MTSLDSNRLQGMATCDTRQTTRSSPGIPSGATSTAPNDIVIPVAAQASTGFQGRQGSQGDDGPASPDHPPVTSALPVAEVVSDEHVGRTGSISGAIDGEALSDRGVLAAAMGHLAVSDGSEGEDAWGGVLPTLGTSSPMGSPSSLGSLRDVWEGHGRLLWGGERTESEVRGGDTTGAGTREVAATSEEARLTRDCERSEWVRAWKEAEAVMAPGAGDDVGDNGQLRPLFNPAQVGLRVLACRLPHEESNVDGLRAIFSIQKSLIVDLLTADGRPTRHLFSSFFLF